MLKRTIVGAGLLAVLLALVWLHGIYLQVAVVLMALGTQYEMIKTLKTGGIKPVSVVLYAFTLLVLPVYRFLGGLSGVFVLQMFAVILLFVAGIIFDAFNFESIVSSVFTLYYPQLFFVFLYMIILLPDVELSRLIILMAFATAACTDVFAYFIGSLFGKKKLCPNISPKKTVEGALGGLVGGIVGSMIVAILFDNGRVHLVEYAILALVLSALAQIGDLAASVVKRRYGVKDFGSIFPGHGGLLDRFDSMLFIMPIIYMFYKLYLHF
ncbi:MAG: CDP-archaeol synthase [Christensenellaceae bacterium]|nr:CDP-archaeol synthase [Christensenellaceae bacterium]